MLFEILEETIQPNPSIISAIINFGIKPRLAELIPIAL